MASIANDTAMLDELINGSGDLHSLTAKMVFTQIPRDTPLVDIKEKYHDLRSDAKGYEFCFNYKSTLYICVALCEKSIDENRVNCKNIVENLQPSQPLTKLEGSTTND